MELYEYGLSLFTKQKRGMMRAAVNQKRLADPALMVATPTSSTEPLELKAAGPISGSEAIGTARVTIIHTEVLDSQGRSDQICSGETCTVRVLIGARENVDTVTISLIIANLYGQMMFGSRSTDHGVQFSMGAGDFREVLFRMPFRLTTGTYRVTVSASRSDWSGVPEHIRSALAAEAQEVYDLVANAATISVTRFAGPRFYGVCDLAPSVWATGNHDLAERFDCEFSQPIIFSSTGLGRRHLCAGWSEPEEWGTWTMRHAAHLLFGRRRFPNRDVILKATVLAFCPESFPSLTAEVVLNGLQLSVWRIEGNEARVLEVRISAILTQGPLLHLLFRILDPRSPAMAGVSADDRLLGIALHQVEFCDIGGGLDNLSSACQPCAEAS
jgi:hypothetical protein